MPTVTNANHTAMMTGAYAGNSGIAGNEFALYAPLENGDSCAATGPEDTRALPTTTSGENRNCPQAEMVFEAIKRQGNPRGLVTAGIFGKPKLGRIFAGQERRPRRAATSTTSGRPAPQAPTTTTTAATCRPTRSPATRWTTRR